MNYSWFKLIQRKAEVNEEEKKFVKMCDYRDLTASQTTAPLMVHSACENCIFDTQIIVVPRKFSS